MAAMARRLSRRRLIGLGAAAAAAGVLGRGSLRVSAAALRGEDGSSASSAATVATSTGRVLYRGCAIADGRSSNRALNQSILVDGGRISWIRPRDSEGDPGPSSGLEIYNAAGNTAVPGMVDAHCHLTSPGGKNYIARFSDPPRQLLETAERNGSLAQLAGTAWLRDAGSPTVVDPIDGRNRAFALGIRDRWAARNDRPTVRSAGTWLAVPGGLTSNIGIEVENVEQLVAAALQQLEQGADLVKLYVEPKRGRESPWTAAEIRRVVDAVHARGAKVTAHAMWLKTARAAVLGGVDAIEHGFHLDAELCAEMAGRGTYLVTTLIVPKNWLRLGATTSGTFWSTRAGRRYARNLLAAGEASADLARKAGVKIAAGTDFGGGSPRAGQLAWEVESLVKAGLQPWQALGAATWRGGDLLGQPSAGRLREGTRADFFLVDGDPLSDPSALWNVRRLA